MHLEDWFRSFLTVKIEASEKCGLVVGVKAHLRIGVVGS